MIFELRILVRTLILPPACLLILGFAGLLLARRYRGLGVALTAAALAAFWQDLLVTTHLRRTNR
jgi:hypothetical protein